MGFVVPRLLARMSRMPASSSTARTPPPAMTPVPSLAGRSMTRAASKRPRISCVIVVPVLRHREEVLLRVVDGLRDRERHLARLAVADADAIDLVADHDERREREPPAALDDLRDAVDLDDALLELARLLARDLVDAAQNFSPPSRARRRAPSRARGTGSRRGRRRRSRSRPSSRCGEQLADLGRLLGLAALERLLQLLPARGGERPAGHVVDELRPIPRFERNTTSRGRSAVPGDLARTRRWRRMRACADVSVAHTPAFRPSGGRTRPA